MKSLFIFNAVVYVFLMLFAGCVVVLPSKKEEEAPKDCVNPEGPWYSPQFLEENPQFKSDMYLCSNYYKGNSGSSPFGPRPKVPYYKSRKTGEDGWTRHNVPIICGTRDGQCGITECECVCHK